MPNCDNCGKPLNDTGNPCGHCGKSHGPQEDKRMKVDGHSTPGDAGNAARADTARTDNAARTDTARTGTDRTGNAVRTDNASSALRGYVHGIGKLDISGMTEAKFSGLTDQFDSLLLKMGIPDQLRPDEKVSISAEQSMVANAIRKKMEAAERQFGKAVGNPATFKRLAVVEQFSGNPENAAELHRKAGESWYNGVGDREEGDMKGDIEKPENTEEIDSFGRSVTDIFESIEEIDDRELEFSLKSDDGRQLESGRVISGSVVDSQFMNSNVAMGGSTIIDKRSVIDKRNVTILVNPRDSIELRDNWLRMNDSLPSICGITREGKEILCRKVPDFMQYRKAKLEASMKNLGAYGSSSGIAAFSGVEKIGGSLYMVRDYIQGMPLDYYLNHPDRWEEEEFSVTSFLDILKDTCKTLKMKRGMNHGSLHAGNIIFTEKKITVITDYRIEAVKEFIQKENPFRHETGSNEKSLKEGGGIRMPPGEHITHHVPDLSNLSNIIGTFIASAKLSGTAERNDKHTIRKLKKLNKEIDEGKIRTMGRIGNELDAIYHNPQESDNDEPLFGSWAISKNRKWKKL